MLNKKKILNGVIMEVIFTSILVSTVFMINIIIMR
ncbi:hypothetical protein JOC70_001415 [Clostridium pascui]|nr:hypothetical protein [Clostridium pascui]